MLSAICDAVHFLKSKLSLLHGGSDFLSQIPHFGAKGRGLFTSHLSPFESRWGILLKIPSWVQTLGLFLRILGGPLPLPLPRRPLHPLQPQLQPPLHRQGAPHPGEHSLRGAAAVRERRRHGLRACLKGYARGGVREGTRGTVRQDEAGQRGEAAGVPKEG